MFCRKYANDMNVNVTATLTEIACRFMVMQTTTIVQFLYFLYVLCIGE